MALDGQGPFPLKQRASVKKPAWCIWGLLRRSDTSTPAEAVSLQLLGRGGGALGGRATWAPPDPSYYTFGVAD